MRIAQQGPFTIRDIEHLFPSYEKTRLCVAGMERAKMLARLGLVQLKEWGGRREVAFGAPSLRIKKDWLQHDTMLLRYLRLLPNAAVVTGTDCDPKLRADAEVCFSTGRFAYVEMDRETESLRDCEQRWNIFVREQKDAFERIEKWVLFLTLTDCRIEQLKRRAAGHPIGDAILFGRWYDVVADHAGEVFQDIAGERVSVCPAGG